MTLFIWWVPFTVTTSLESGRRPFNARSFKLLTVSALSSILRTEQKQQQKGQGKGFGEEMREKPVLLNWCFCADPKTTCPPPLSPLTLPVTSSMQLKTSLQLTCGTSTWVSVMVSVFVVITIIIVGCGRVFKCIVRYREIAPVKFCWVELAAELDVLSHVCIARKTGKKVRDQSGKQVGSCAYEIDKFLRSEIGKKRRGG